MPLCTRFCIKRINRVLFDSRKFGRTNAHFIGHRREKRSKPRRFKTHTLRSVRRICVRYLQVERKRWEFSKTCFVAQKNPFEYVSSAFSIRPTEVAEDTRARCGGVRPSTAPRSIGFRFNYRIDAYTAITQCCRVQGVKCERRKKPVRLWPWQQLSLARGPSSSRVSRRSRIDTE